MKTHLRLAIVPLIEGHTYRAECGRDIKNAHFEFRWDADTEEMKGLSTIRFCADCITEAMHSVLGRQYVYGINEGEQAKQEHVA